MGGAAGGAAGALDVTPTAEDGVRPPLAKRAFRGPRRGTPPEAAALAAAASPGGLSDPPGTPSSSESAAMPAPSEEGGTAAQCLLRGQAWP